MSKEYLITHFSEFQLATVGTFLIHESIFFLSGLPSIYFERSGLFSKYKIQKKSNTSEAQEKCIVRLVLYHIHGSEKQSSIATLVCNHLSNYLLLHLGGFRVLLGTPNTAYQMAIQACSQYPSRCFICRYATPFGLTSEYAHPAEILFLGFATVVGPALTGPHLFTLWLWMILRVLETVEAHSGYHFPWSPSNFLPLYGGLFGTDKGYRKLRAIEEVEGKNY
ncbi:hypothetical protein C4D60_Mb10t04670 [Musa balbisiana]|uniref:Uncharacterized protein n=1 Tax=Musa balbisiana TaxID=52838 RepID=A0A4S8IUS7_MUSBA|nr:hypothetical protein C4D60_Mb10t04670 [Musa balbisiana]